MQCVGFCLFCLRVSQYLRCRKVEYAHAAFLWLTTQKTMKKNINEINRNDKTPTERWEDERFESTERHERRQNIKRGLTFLIPITVIFVAIIIIANQQQSQTTALPITPADTYQPPPAPQHVAALDLFHEYHTNEVKADQDYKGKRVTMIIRIDQVSKDAFDGAYVEYHLGSYGLADLWFYFDDQNYLASLKQGSNLNVEGTCTGMIMGTVIFKNCVPSSNY